MLRLALRFAASCLGLFLHGQSLHPCRLNADTDGTKHSASKCSKTASAKPHMSSRPPKPKHHLHLPQHICLSSQLSATYMSSTSFRTHEVYNQDLHACCMVRTTADQCVEHNKIARIHRLERLVLP